MPSLAYEKTEKFKQKIYPDKSGQFRGANWHDIKV
jgi:hypothetical protein